MKKHSLCVFGPGLSVASLRQLLNAPEYSGDDTTVTVLRSGDDFYLRVANLSATDGSDENPNDINDSHLCPGSPGC